jgi:hypothetical protein
MSDGVHTCNGVLREHYERVWKLSKDRRWSKGPISELPEGFGVLEFEPGQGREMWTYATCGMSNATDERPLELHLFSPVQTAEHVELLTAIAHYHRTGARLDLGHTVNFGRPWLPNSRCSFGLISLPYLDGPRLEILQHPLFLREVHLLWLIPITPEELKLKKDRGLDALEDLLEDANIDYADPLRPSLV